MPGGALNPGCRHPRSMHRDMRSQVLDRGIYNPCCHCHRAIAAGCSPFWCPPAWSAECWPAVGHAFA